MPSIQFASLVIQAYFQVTNDITEIPQMDVSPISEFVLFQKNTKTWVIEIIIVKFVLINVRVVIVMLLLCKHLVKKGPSFISTSIIKRLYYK